MDKWGMERENALVLCTAVLEIEFSFCEVHHFFNTESTALSSGTEKGR